MANDRPNRNGPAAKPTPAPAPEPAKSRPVHEVRMGRVCGAVWLQQGGDGKTWHNVTFSRIYVDSDGRWQRADSFGKGDLPLVAKVADLCHTWIYGQAPAPDDNG